MAPEIIEKIQTLGRLMAESPIDEQIKTAIVEHIGSFTEEQLDMLITSFEREARELVSILRDLAVLDATEAERWEKLQTVQEVSATEELDAFLETVGVEDTSYWVDK